MLLRGARVGEADPRTNAPDDVLDSLELTLRRAQTMNRWCIPDVPQRRSRMLRPEYPSHGAGVEGVQFQRVCNRGQIARVDV